MDDRGRLPGPLLRAARCLSAFARDRRGGVAVFIGAAIIPLIGALGLATDAARGYMVKARLSQAVDAAALAGGKVMFSAARDDDVRMFFNANFPPGFMAATVAGPTIAVDPTSTYITVSAEATIATTFMRVLGYHTLTVSSSAEVTRQIDALDLVISLDMSGSMDGAAKIGAAREAALDLVDALFGTSTTAPTVTVDGTTYNLLNIGFVPWNSKVRVTIQGQSFQGVEAVTVPSFTNPVTGATQTTIWYARVGTTVYSPVPLLNDPRSQSATVPGGLPGGWTGCIYARYVGDGDNTNDADLTIGQGTLGSVLATRKDWLAYEPMSSRETQGRSGNWNSDPNPPSTGDQIVNTTPTNWVGRSRNCYQTYWNDSNNNATDVPTSGSATIPTPGARPTPSWWRPPAARFTNDCSNCLSRGITPLTPNKAAVVGAISGISDSDPDGNTNIPQGLFWAWDVLMPGEPFDQAVATVPFPRQRAIVLLTDGEIVGGNGDAYKGHFGSGTPAGTTTNSFYGTLPSGARNNLNNRLLQLATNVKAQGIKLFVIGFDLADNPTALNLLQQVASPPDSSGTYFFNAPTASELQDAFNNIASQLSKLRLSK